MIAAAALVAVALALAVAGRRGTLGKVEPATSEWAGA